MVFAAATNNLKKLAEIQRILDSLGHTVKTLEQLGINVTIKEDGVTFSENAIIKAKEIAKISGYPTISDDSGLEVDYLHGAPGVYTARYAGENASDDANIDKLLNALNNVEEKNRTARFVSAVCLYMPDDRYIVCEGKCEGYIGFDRLGTDGFGYDPIFMVNDKSFAQMNGQEKDAISHRGKALKLLQEKIKTIQLG